MTRADVPSKPLPPGVSRGSEIDKRAEALRENLKKRKAQTATKNKQDISNEIPNQD